MARSALFHIPQSSQGRLAHDSVKLLVALQLLLLALVLVGVYLTSHHLRNVALEHMHSHAQTQTHTKEDRLTHSLDLLQMHLWALISEHPEAASDKQALYSSLISLQQKLLFVRSLSVADATGQVIVSTQRANEHRLLDLGPLLPEIQPHTPDQLRIGAPWSGRDFASGHLIQAGETDPLATRGFIPVTMVLPEAPQWTFIIALNSDYFVNLAPEHASDGELVFRAFRDDGILLFSTAEHDLPGSRPLPPEQLEEILLRHVGASSRDSADGVMHLTAFRTSRSYPVFVQSEVSSDFILKKWATETRRLWVASIVTLAVMLLVSGFLTVRVRRSLQNEARSVEENRLAASVFMYSSDLIVIADADKHIIAVNPAFKDITGYSAQDALGRMHWRVAPDSDEGAVYRDLWARLETQQGWQGEVTERHKDGSEIIGWLQVNSIRDQAGNIVNYIGVFKDLSRLRESEATIRKLSQAIEQSPSSIVMTTPAAVIEYANPEFLNSSGYSEEEVLGRNPNLLQSGQTPRETYEGLWKRISAGQVWHGEFINRRKNGSIYYERSSISPVLDGKGNLTGYLGIKHDITAEKEAERNMRLAVSVIANTAECVMICDEQRSIIEVNPAFSRVTGYSRDEALGHEPEFLGAGARNDASNSVMEATLAAKGEWQGEFWNRHKDGSLYVVSSSVNVLRDDENNITHYISVFSDITEDELEHENLQKQAYFDLLTGLPNRVLLHERLEQTLIKARVQNHWFALCFMDLDGFKQVNDTLGHAAGDQLLVVIAERLKNCVRGNDMVARIGGDEFVLILSPVSCLEECERIAERILKTVAAPVPLGEKNAYVTGSLGITIYPLDSGNSDQLLSHADHAMYQAKQNGRNCYVLSNKISGDADD